MFVVKQLGPPFGPIFNAQNIVYMHWPRFAGFGPTMRKDGLSSTLRAHNNALWFVDLRESQTVGEDFSRPLHIYERVTLQGFRAEMCEHMSAKAGTPRAGTPTPSDSLFFWLLCGVGGLPH